MKKAFDDTIDLSIYLNDSPEAKGFEFKSAASVFLNKEHIPLLVALSHDKMITFLKERLET